jgi:hypothetical protein
MARAMPAMRPAPPTGTTTTSTSGTCTPQIHTHTSPIHTHTSPIDTHTSSIDTSSIETHTSPIHTRAAAERPTLTCTLRRRAHCPGSVGTGRWGLVTPRNVWSREQSGHVRGIT